MKLRVHFNPLTNGYPYLKYDDAARFYVSSHVHLISEICKAPDMQEMEAEKGPFHVPTSKLIAQLQAAVKEIPDVLEFFCAEEKYNEKLAPTFENMQKFHAKCAYAGITVQDMGAGDGYDAVRATLAAIEKFIDARAPVLKRIDDLLHKKKKPNAKARGDKKFQGEGKIPDAQKNMHLRSPKKRY